MDHDAQGSWGENSHGVITPGFTFLMALNESGGVIGGTGSFAGEAGPYGGLAVSGAVANDSLHLQIIYVAEPHVFPSLQPDTARFTGVLTNRDQIDGEMTRNGSTFPLGLIRLKIGDPP
ncbi:MAG TPA: hypothetical protein VH277_17040 [Gemmatimonadaceae bacterium]|nr:hypothetical protein [Gemmatimonadaceae bacterium]